jgi:hypothetical protein
VLTKPAPIALLAVAALAALAAAQFARATEPSPALDAMPPTPTNTAGAASAVVATSSAMSRLRVTTDAACALEVDGAPEGTLAAGASRDLARAPGETTLACTSLASPDARVRLVRMLRGGEDTTIALPVGDALVARSCASREPTLVELGGGTLRHCVTKADWTQADNGGDLDWEAAKALCATKGGGWQLPTADEYTALVDRSGRSTTACGKHTCYVSPRFALTSAVFWAADEAAPGNAMMMTMIYGNRHPARKTISGGYRALCVRHRTDGVAVSEESGPRLERIEGQALDSR